jgi:uncharacterized protein
MNQNQPSDPSGTASGAAPAPLKPEDFDFLDGELDALREHNPDVPEWEFCEGFLAALICTRRPIEPAEYWPELMGGEFSPMQHMEFNWRWKRRQSEIETALDAPVQALDEDQAYQPEMLDVRGALAALPPDQKVEEELDIENSGAIPSYGQLWALGFMTVVETWPEEWAPPRDKEAAALLQAALDDIETLTEDDRAAPEFSMFAEDGPPSVSRQRLEQIDLAVWAVYDLRRFWRSLGPRTVTVRKEAEPGRNDPCPCGSGKKFKKCHGAT